MASAPPEVSPSGRREEFVLRSGVRQGHKRELAFALKARAELQTTPMSRTRSGKVQLPPSAPSRGPTAKRRRKSGASDAPPTTPAALERRPILPAAIASPVAETAVAVDMDSGEMVGGATNAALPTVEVDGSTAMRIESGSVVKIPPTIPMEAGAVPDTAPSIRVDAKPVVEVPQRVQAEAEAVADVVHPIQAEEKPVAEMPRTGQTEAEALEGAIPSIQAEEKPVVEMPQTVRTEAEPMADTAPSIQVDAKPVMEVPQTVQTEAETVPDVVHLIQAEAKPVTEMPWTGQTATEAVEGVVPSIQAEEKPVVERPQTVWTEAEPMVDMVSSVQAEVKPVMEMPQTVQTEAEAMADTIPSIQAEAKTVVEIPSEMGDRISQKAEENGVLEKRVRRFTRSLLRTEVKEPPPTIVEESPALVVEDSLAASGGSDGLEEIKDSAHTTNSLEESISVTPKMKMELKMSKKVALSKFPSSIRELLATGLLEGLTVMYITDSFGKQEGLRGVIKGGGILCFCASCRGLKTISAYHFELHAGSKKKHPSDFIYLENGNTIRDILRACYNAPLDMLESTIQNAISFKGPKSLSFDKCKGSSIKSIGKLESTCGSGLVPRLSPTSPNLSQEGISTARCSRSIFSPKSSDSTSNNISSQKNSQGRMTKKDLRMHKLVFTDGILPDGTEVAYYARGQRLLEGYIKGSGIFCHCCNAVISPSQFEAHAGWPLRRKPYLNIYTSNGVSLHELSISLSKGKKLSASESDDLCRICADGGDLLLCDICPRAFHKECVGLTSVPKGDWYCPCCQNMQVKDKAVGHNENAIAAGRIAGVDPIEQIFNRCIRIVKMPVADVGGCVLCRCHHFGTGFGPRTVLLCDQCEREFHVGCLKEHNMGDLMELPEGKWFCCSDCGRIHAALQNLLASGAEQLPIFKSDVIKKKQEEKGLNQEMDLDVRWRLLSGKTAAPETRLLLSQALSIFYGSFDPIIDFATKKDFIPAMVYGREIRDQDFGGMSCAVLIVNSSVVSAAILRVFGCEVAELPLVATSRESQGKGYFQLLFSCIEGMLDSLKVKHLVLPAADEAESIWTQKFGFTKITPDQLPESAKGFQTMVFEGTSMLHKLVPKHVTDV